MVGSIVALATYYDASLKDRPYEAVTPSVWTSVALSLSIITASIPSMKTFFEDLAAGVSAGVVNEAIELDHSTGRSLSKVNAHRQDFGSRGNSEAKLGLFSTNRDKATSGNRSCERRNHIGFDICSPNSQRGPSLIDSSSMEGLTNGGITRTIEYHVESENASLESMSTAGKEYRGYLQD